MTAQPTDTKNSTRGRKGGVPAVGSQTDVISRLPLLGVAYFEFDITERSAQSYAAQIASLLSRQMRKIDASRRFTTQVHTAVPAVVGAKVRHVIRVERVS